MDFENVARELIRAIRGRRSQRGFSRRLGYSTNVLYAWESGRRSPTAAEFLRAARLARVDLRAGLRRFFPTPPAWLDELEPDSPEAVAALLRSLRGDVALTDLARRSGCSRHVVGRRLAGTTEPRLPDFLRMIEVCSLRLLDFLAVLVDPESLPSARGPWRALVARREMAATLPWSQAVLRAVELSAYRALPAHRPGWIAERLGISPEEEERCIEALTAAGQLRRRRGRYEVDEVGTVDTRLDPEAGRRMREHWSLVARDRIAAGRPGQFSYNVFAVSRADFERIRELHLAYFRGLRGVVAGSQPSECVAVVNVQLFELDEQGA